MEQQPAKSLRREVFPIRVFDDTGTFARISLHPAQIRLLIQWLIEIQTEV